MRDRHEMLAMLQRAVVRHERHDGQVPFWMEMLAGAELLEWALDRCGERPDDATREELVVAALGRDLYERTAVQPDDVRLRWGERVARWIAELTNERDARTEAARIAAASEHARLIALAAWVEATLHAAYALHETGPALPRRALLPLATEVRDVLHAATFTAYPRTAAFLLAELDFAHALLCRNLAMFERAEQLPRPHPPVREPGPRREISAEVPDRDDD